MKLLFKQRFFSWFDSYDIYNEAEETQYTVKGQLSWGHCFKIYDKYNNEVGMVKQVILTFLPKFEIYINNKYVGCIKKEFSFFKNNYNIDFNGYHINGDFFGWEYEIIDRKGNLVAQISKELFNFTDTYAIDIVNAADALPALILVLAIDAEKCSAKNN